MDNNQNGQQGNQANPNMQQGNMNQNQGMNNNQNMGNQNKGMNKAPKKEGKKMLLMIVVPLLVIIVVVALLFVLGVIGGSDTDDLIDEDNLAERVEDSPQGNNTNIPFQQEFSSTVDQFRLVFDQYQLSTIDVDRSTSTVVDQCGNNNEQNIRASLDGYNNHVPNRINTVYSNIIFELENLGDSIYDLNDEEYIDSLFSILSNVDPETSTVMAQLLGEIELDGGSTTLGPASLLEGLVQEMPGCETQQVSGILLRKVDENYIELEEFLRANEELNAGIIGY